MSIHVEQVRSRIESGRIRAEDIRHQNRLTDDEIANLDVELVYSWVRTGQWKQKHFQQWLRVMRVIE
jgi:flagellar basal body L-ring protein FlgH